jgi:hypothetical protein
MDLQDIFYLLGIIVMASWLILMIMVFVLFAKIKNTVEEAKIEFQKKRIEAERTVKKFSDGKLLGILPIMPIVAYFAKKMFTGIRKKVLS